MGSTNRSFGLWPPRFRARPDLRFQSSSSRAATSQNLKFWNQDRASVCGSHQLLNRFLGSEASFGIHSHVFEGLPFWNSSRMVLTPGSRPKPRPYRSGGPSTCCGRRSSPDRPRARSWAELSHPASDLGIEHVGRFALDQDELIQVSACFVAFNAARARPLSEVAPRLFRPLALLAAFMASLMARFFFGLVAGSASGCDMGSHCPSR